MSPSANSFHILARQFFAATAAIASSLLLIELVARYGLGLGTPPLSIAHPTIEYLFKPNQDIRRFGNRFKTNAFGMRSDEFPEQPSSQEKRILVFGDSVVTGGAQMDQQAIATELLKRRLIASNPGAVVNVGNVSAGSWGPGNWMAWLNEYGHLGATRVILVISSHDLEDHPTFASLNPITHPSQDPPSATYELFSRYLNVNSVLNKLRSQGLLRETPPIQPADPQPGDNPSPGRFAPLQKISNRREVGLIELRKLFIALQSKGVKVGVVQFWERDETVSGNPRAEHALLLDLFREIRIPVVQSGDYFRRCSANPSVELYVDAIHPYTEAGQSCLADAIEAALKELEPMH